MWNQCNEWWTCYWMPMGRRKLLICSLPPLLQPLVSLMCSMFLDINTTLSEGISTSTFFGNDFVFFLFSCLISFLVMNILEIDLWMSLNFKIRANVAPTLLVKVVFDADTTLIRESASVCVGPSQISASKKQCLISFLVIDFYVGKLPIKGAKEVMIKYLPSKIKY